MRRTKTAVTKGWGSRKKKGNKGERQKLTGVMTVRSGRWLPPAQGWLLRITSPSLSLFPCALICKEQTLQYVYASSPAAFFESTLFPPGTGQFPAWLPGEQVCEVHWILDLHPVQTRHKRSQGAPWCLWRWRFSEGLFPSALWWMSECYHLTSNSLELLCPSSFISFFSEAYQLCSWSGGRRWRAAPCWAPCRGCSEDLSPQSCRRPPLLSGGLHSTAPQGWCCNKKPFTIPP